MHTYIHTYIHACNNKIIRVYLLFTDKPLIDGVCRAVVVEDYLPTASDELGLVKGQTVEVLKKTSYGWWTGRIADKMGIFPNQNVKLVEHQQQEETAKEFEHGCCCV